MNEIEIYGHEKLFGAPEDMQEWGVWVETFEPTSYGEYALIGLEPAGIEGGHQVVVIDENGRPLDGVGVVFGYPGGGPDINARPRINLWPGSPRVLKGNLVYTLLGQAQHTFQSGGEDIWIWDIDLAGVLKYPSAIVRNCKWIKTGKFIHHGVRATFQRRDSAIQPERVQLIQLEKRLERLEKAVDALIPGSLVDLFGS